MDATRPLLGSERVEESDGHSHNGYANGSAHRRMNGSAVYRGTFDSSDRTTPTPVLMLDDAGASADDTSWCSSCSRLLCCISGSGDAGSPMSGYKALSSSSQRDRLLSNGTSTSTTSNGTSHGHWDVSKGGRDASPLLCSNWKCWKWIFPDRVTDYDDFVSPDEMGEIFFIRQKTREFFDAGQSEDTEMLHHLWNALFPTLPYDGRKNPRWRDVGFQNDDPASDFRSSGRFGLKMLLYFADHMNDEFKRLVRENRFPVCLIALNVIEMLLIHLNLKDPLPLVCPCCGPTMPSWRRQIQAATAPSSRASYRF
ncbi:hypothetical protein PINS_up023533 [Pythium insidiosum]|nr:hypothetical protein PINS_up023533 [Pythium insidiosum]